MAGTRRRSRVGDTRKSHRQAGFAYAESTIDESGAAAEVPPPEGTEEVESVELVTSARPDTSTNRSTKGFCKNCGTNIGEYYNSWHKVTGSYYVPALLGSYRSLLKNSGQQKPASRGTAIEGW
jgi:hypothetical protein